jgi:hypothetical protein
MFIMIALFQNTRFGGFIPKYNPIKNKPMKIPRHRVQRAVLEPKTQMQRVGHWWQSGLSNE